jgi:hypothetical protein
VEPSKEAFDLPTAASPSQRTAVLGAGAAATVRRNHLDPVGREEGVVERVAVDYATTLIPAHDIARQFL